MALSTFGRLDSEDLAAIREATREAESRTGGELVCVLVRRCDPYEGMPWKGGLLGAIAGVALAAAWLLLAAGWSASGYWAFPLLTLVGGAVGFIVVLTQPGIKRLLVPAQVLDRRADRRAATAFVEEEIFDTRDRTGILLFVAFFEHRVRILADKGIERRVDPAVWTSITKDLTRGLRAGRPRESLIAAIEACGSVLEEAVDRRHDDANELSDEPRLLDE